MNRDIPLTEAEYYELERLLQWPEDLEEYDKLNFQIINDYSELCSGDSLILSCPFSFVTASAPS